MQFLPIEIYDVFLFFPTKTNAEIDIFVIIPSTHNLNINF